MSDFVNVSLAYKRGVLFDLWDELEHEIGALEKKFWNFLKRFG